MKTFTHTRFRSARDDGQTFVEFALVLPILVILVFGIIQFGLTFRNYLAITDAARVAARAAAVKRTDNPCVTVVPTKIQNTVSPDQWDELSKPGRIMCTAGPDVGDEVKITIKYTYKIGLPGVGAVGDLTASSTERME